MSVRNCERQECERKMEEGGGVLLLKALGLTSSRSLLLPVWGLRDLFLLTPYGVDSQSLLQAEETIFELEQFE